MTRSAAREIAVRLCFSAQMLGEWSASTADDFFDSTYYETLKTEDPLFAQPLDAEQAAYIRSLFETVSAHKDEADEYISKYAKGWTVSRISKISLAILRCAICEILYSEDVPAGAAINEAVEIAKRYEEPETVSFINGVLGSFYRGERENA